MNGLRCQGHALTWSMRRWLRNDHGFMIGVSRHHHGKPAPSSVEIRKTFIDFFRQNDHQYVHSSSVVPKKSDGVYFVNAGMNQFKPIFLGTVDPQSEMASYKRAVNSQKCVRVGGKHNDLDDVGQDCYHHTFFEMLGSWSFGDYFKREACSLAWELLTQQYKLPASRLYVTYFGGDEQLGLAPDTECQEIWHELGVHPDRVLPFGMTDNFWDMGETGPCGPCTEIHYDHTGGQVPEVKHLVNSGDPKVIELWNLVFMQFERQRDGSLLHLPRQHVDTGMGLERLTAVLQGAVSNYDTDLFMPLFSSIQQKCSIPVYRGRIGVEDEAGLDTAYRIVTDHIRMITIAMSDGLMPGRKDLDYRLRQMMNRCFQRARQILNAPLGMVGSLVPLVVDSLGEAFPELTRNPQQIQDSVNNAEQKYIQSIEEAHRILKKALHAYGNVNHLTGAELLEMCEGRFGRRVGMDALVDVCSGAGIHMDIDGYHLLVQKQNRSSMVADTASQTLMLNQYDVEHLQSMDVPATDDLQKYSWTRKENVYEFPSITTTVGAVKHGARFVNGAGSGDDVGVVLNSTPLYAEAGGQIADVGTLITDSGCVVEISDVQATRGYLLHTGTVSMGTLSTHDKVTVCVDSDHRMGCMRAHTSTHLINAALRQVLGVISQQGSSVKANRLTFDFTCLASQISTENIKEISDILTTAISHSLPVSTMMMPLQAAMRVPGVVSLVGEAYPHDVRVVSVGGATTQETEPSLSVELCGGTHVENTQDIGTLVITNLEGVAQGTKRITAMTGPLAKEAVEHGQYVEQMLTDLENKIKAGHCKEDWQGQGNAIEAALFDGRILPKVCRDQVLKSLENLRTQSINIEKNVSRKQQLQKELQALLAEHKDSDYIVTEFNFGQVRDMVAVLGNTPIDKPLFAVGATDKNIQAVCLVPKNSGTLTAALWVNQLTQTLGGAAGKAKKAKDLDIHVYTLLTKNGAEKQETIECAKKLILLIK